jgi:uncharacterized protein (DUF302 family)
MFTGILIGLGGGIILTFLVLYLSAPKMMFRESPSPLGFEATVDKVQKAVDDHGWKTPAVHDLQATLKKFGKDVKSVKVFEICQPDHAYEILSRNSERIVSNMMPCRIAVYEKKDGSVWISRMNSGLVAKPLSPVIRKTMSVAAADVEDILAEVVKE